MQKDLPGYNMEIVKKRIRELQEKYEKEIKPREKDYNEENTKKGFIEPILRILNWDTEDINQVDAEFCIKNKRSFGSADYALKINGEVKLLLEAKSFDKDLETGYDIIHGQKRTYVEQLVGYAFDLNRHLHTKIDYCILTNGKEWRVYNVRWQGIAFDKKLMFLIKIDEFLDKFVKFWSLEKGNVAKGDLDRIISKEDKIPVDKKAVTSLLYCKKLLIDSMLKDYENNNRDMRYMIDKLINNPVKDAPNGFPKFHEMPEEERLNKFVLEASSNVINKILFIRIIEDKGYLKPKLTKRSVEEWKSWFSQADRILRLFREACHEADVQYNGGIFDVNPYDTLNYDNDVLDKIISILGDFNFEEIDADVIGRIYEIYLGTILSIEEEIRGKKRTKLSADYTERKKLGQYYTPKFVVDYIVKNTLGKLLEGKTPEEVSKIKVLDPACGSGSFLIRAFDYLKDYYVRYNDKQMQKIKKNSTNDMNNWINNHQIIDYNHKILKDNLHGVDLNYLSTQVCSINLWLRALEKDKKLEKLSKNILHGNSLISGVESKEELAKYKSELKEIAELREKIKDYYGRELSKREKDELEEMEAKLKELKDKVNKPLNENLKKYFENLDLVCPFNWEVEFTEVFDPDKPEEEQGFDVIIGNPPYVRSERIPTVERSFLNQYYSSIEHGKNDLYVYFIYNVIELMKHSGRFGYIVSNKFFRTAYGKKLRNYILNNTCIETIIDLSGLKVFEDVTVDPCILILKKEKIEKIRKENLINIIKINSFISEENLIEDINLAIQSKKSYGCVDFFIVKQDDLSDNPWKLIPKRDQNLFNKIEKNSQLLCEIADVREAIHPTPKEVFVIDQKTKSEENLKENIIKKVLDGKNIHRYNLEWGRIYLIYPHKYKDGKVIPVDLKDYPFTKAYLQKHKKKLNERKYLLEAGQNWFELWNQRNPQWFEQPKIITPDIATRNSFTYDNNNLFCLNTCYVILPKSKNKDEHLYLLGILNSKVSEFYLKKFASTLSKGGYRYKKQYLERIPISRLNKNKDKIIKLVRKILELNLSLNKIKNKFNNALNNQPISDEKSCKFAHYWNHSDLYNFSKETIPFANKTKAKILDMDIKEENNKLIIYTTNVSLVQNKKFENIKTIELTIKDDILRKFLYFSFKKYINGKKGRGFGSGIILEIIKKIPIPVYVANVKMNFGKIKQVMREFEHETKNLWKINGKTYKTLTEIEEDIEKTDKDIDEMVYELYGITEKEKKIIEESLK
jgi:type I restriction-modification system DNA methylase subunit